MLLKTVLRTYKYGRFPIVNFRHRDLTEIRNRKKIIETDIENNNQINEKKASIFQKLGSYYQDIQSKYELALNNSKKSQWGYCQR